MYGSSPPARSGSLIRVIRPLYTATRRFANRPANPHPYNEPVPDTAIRVHPLPYFATHAWWLILFWATYYSWIIAELWLIRRDAKRVRGVHHDRGSRALLILAMIFCLSGALSFGFIFSIARIPIPPSLGFALGLALMWTGIVLRFWSVHILGRFFRTSVFVQEDHRLVDTGPYRLLRNPSYTGLLITLIGLGIATGNWVSLALVVIGPLIALIRRIKIEQAAMVSHFGRAYADYSARTWSLIPWIW